MITLNWYVAYTKTRCEQKVANLLSRKHIRNYCPLQKVQNYWSEWKRMTLEPLFPSYVFLQTTAEELKNITATTGILSVIHWHDSPAIIPEEEITMIMHFLQEHEIVKLIKSTPEEDTSAGTQNRLYNQQPTLQAINNSPKVVLPTLGYTIYAPFKTETVTITGIDSGSIAF